MALYAAVVFLSAFLLFQVQPLIAKAILPWFGGSGGVWTACMLFFQLALLGGYLYSHYVVARLTPLMQGRVHLGLLAAAVVTLPIVPSAAWKPAGGEDPTLRILGLLAVTVGLPYFALATTGPLLQAWFARDSRMVGRAPYRLYALSNVGSMLALVTYPVAVEPWLTNRAQEWMWSGAFVLFAGLCGWMALGVRSREAEAVVAGERPSILQWMVWASLAAVASALLLATTNHVSQNVAAIPFLWVVPLALYLLTFILAFDWSGWYRREFFLKLAVVAMGAMAYALQQSTDNLPIKFALPLFTIGMFVVCMVLHGELAAMKPEAGQLTSFFLAVAAGGAMGGLFVGVIAPMTFSGHFELAVVLGAAAVLILVVERRVYQAGTHPAYVVCTIAVAVFAGYLISVVKTSGTGHLLMTRNFYGAMKVSESEGVRTLTHGTINHGEQYVAAPKRYTPVTYYGANSGVALPLTEKPRLGVGRHIGVIGLGTGTLAAYGKPGDRVRFYEINPLVIDLANTWFWYTRDTKAKVDYALGDARVSLEREAPQGFDVLAVDAFSSDSIPVHLLTVEAFELYRKHLKPDGVLCVHVSNKFLDLKPVAQMAAERMGWETRVVDSDDDERDPAVFGSTWVLATADKGFWELPKVKSVAWTLNRKAGMKAWTDDFSNLYQILK